MKNTLSMLAALGIALSAMPSLAAGPGVPATYVMEMRPLPLDAYEPLTVTYATECAVDPRFLARWPEVYPLVLSNLDRDKVVAMSGWSQEAMHESYVFAPDLEAQPVAFACSDRYQVLEVIVETIPIHSPCVTRWLKAYLVIDLADEANLAEILYTIRGERQE